jgi:alpha-tubulin suppressor-like RCC1 family protein
MATKFRFNYNNQTVDFEDYYVRIDNFLQGNLWAWGRNSLGDLGDNSTVHRSSPVQTIAGGNNWKKVAGIGLNNSVGIKSDGTLWTWGGNSFGEQGNSSSNDRSSPAQTVSTTTNWSSIGSCNNCYHVAAIKTDGSLWLWGRNNSGQLGDNTITNKSSPVQVTTRTFDWKQVSCGNGITTAIKTDGTLWVWGDGFGGALGNNSVTGVSSPVQTVALGSNWAKISTGSYHVAAIKTDGTLWMWGFNSSGQLGNNTTTHRSSPVQIVTGGNWKEISSGGNHACGIKTDGTLWCWGKASDGQLGNNRTPTFIADLSVSSPVQTIAFGNNWKYVSCGYDFTTAIKTDGTLWTWGTNAYFGTPIGNLGDNTGVSKSSPVQTIMYGTSWASLSCGKQHVLAIQYV